MTQEFTVPGRLPGANEYIKACRTKSVAANHMKHMAQASVEAAILAAGLEPMKPPVSIEIEWVEPNKRRDPDNICFGAKFVLDALVETKVLGGDGWKWVCPPKNSLAVDAKNPHVHVVLTQGKESI